MTDEKKFMFIAGMLRQDGLVPVDLRGWFVECLDDPNPLFHDMWWNMNEFAVNDMFEDIYNFVQQVDFFSWRLLGNMLFLEQTNAT